MQESKYLWWKPQDLPATETLHTVAWEEINQSFNQRILHPSMLNLERYKSQLSEPKKNGKDQNIAAQCEKGDGFLQYGTGVLPCGWGRKSLGIAH